MKYSLFLVLLLLFLITKINSGITEKERKKFLKKYAKLTTLIEAQAFYPLDKIYFNPGETITYDPAKVSEVIQKYNFPQNYNFIEAEKPQVHIKNQNSCGSCWAFASTTALSYRFHKLGIDVNLSPQYPISCKIKTCSTGDYPIDSQFYLVKNGTVTEECFPYSSGDGVTIPECPTKCKDGSDLTKYYAKDVYAITNEYYQENYYDIVALIMDQLINHGPVVSSIDSYEDFHLLRSSSSSNCANTIYKYNGNSKSKGKHAIVIIGYGYKDSKYYWIIQNSWGEEFCDGGFAKIEFAQVSVEMVTFAEPYVPNNSTEKDISIKLSVGGDCKIKFDTNLNDDENSFELNFKSDTSSESNFYYQCGLIPIQNKNNGVCNYNHYYLNNYKGNYQYSNYQSLAKKNKFNIDLSSGNKFYYYGADLIRSMFYDGNFYVSEIGSKLFFLFKPLNSDQRLASKIYINQNSQTNFSDCNVVKYQDGDYFVILCSITQNELNYIESSNNKNLPIVYDILCGEKEVTNMIVHKLDKTKYPVFRVNKVVLPQGEELKSRSEFTLVANIEGSLSDYKSNNNVIGAIINVEYNNQNLLKFLECRISKPSSIQNNFEIPCYYIGTTTKYNNVKLYQNTYRKNATDPFEIIINNDITPIAYENYNPPTVIRRSDSHFIHISILSIFNILLFLLN